MYRDDGRSLGAEDVTTILKQMAALLKNMKTYEPASPVVKKSFDIMFASLDRFLSEHESLTLLVREDSLAYGDTVCYRSIDKSESLAFALFRDGIRLITFKRGLSASEIQGFAEAVHEARKADPYQADLVTILWEKELDHISYRAVDAYLEDKEREKIEQLARKHAAPKDLADPDGGVLSEEFVYNELGLSINRSSGRSGQRPGPVSETDARSVIREILEEDETNLLARCITICTEIAYTAETDEMFNNVVSLLGRIVETLVSSGDFLSACCILSDLRLLSSEEDTSTPRRASILDTISRLGERKIIRSIGDQLHDLTESRLEEVFAYLSLMTPTAVGFLCDLLAESERKTVRYMLCRAISIVARSNADSLRRFMLDDRWFVARNMVMIAGMIGSPDVLHLLRLVLSHREPRVRKELARSLGRIRSEASLDMLKELMADECKDVRLAAINSTKEVGSDRAVSFLETTILSKTFGRKSQDEKKEIMVAYGSLNSLGFEFLESIATGERGGFDDESRACAVYGVVETGGAGGVEVLKQLAEGPDCPVRYAAAEVLSEFEAQQELSEYDAAGIGTKTRP